MTFEGRSVNLLTLFEPFCRVRNFQLCRCVRVFSLPASQSVVINLNDNLPFSMKLIPLGQSVINVAEPCVAIAWILALAKNKKKKQN